MNSRIIFLINRSYLETAFYALLNTRHTSPLVLSFRPSRLKGKIKPVRREGWEERMRKGIEFFIG
jgi:hypothetical protein